MVVTIVTTINRVININLGVVILTFLLIEAIPKREHMMHSSGLLKSLKPMEIPRLRIFLTSKVPFFNSLLNKTIYNSQIYSN
jgi:hypothetical protein